MNVKVLASISLSAAILALSMWLILIGCSSHAPRLPETTIIPVTDTYHGVEVVDNYRWLENGEDPEVRRWSKAQNEYARWVLDHIPIHEAIARRLQELYNEASPEYYRFQYRGGVLFALKDQPPNDQPLLVKMESPHDPSTEQVILDPNQLDTTGITAIDFYVVSPDARLVTVSLSEGGTEDGDVHVYEVATGKELPDVIPRVNGPTAGGDIAWIVDGSGFYYTRYPRTDERPPEDMRFYQQVYYHRLGTSTEEDTYVIGEEFPRIAEIEFETSNDGRHVLVIVANGDGGEFAHYLLDPSGKWKQITQFSDMITQGKFGQDNSLYLLSKKGAPRGKILRLPPGKTKLSQAKTVIAESEVVIQGFLPTATKIYIRDLVGGPSQARVLDHAGSFQGLIPLMPVSSVREMVSLGADKILFRNSSYIEPPVCYTYEPAQREPLRTALCVTSPADFSGVEVVREFATSKDGTKVPMSIIRRKGTKLDGKNPTILYGYGGYGASQTPRYDRTLSVWLDHGGVYAIANLRGGGEFGEEWHKAGNLTNKQNVFDDFAACAQYLIEAGYTNPSKLVIKGGSNGGLLVGATMTQHPNLFRAVVCHKGVLDMLRVELDPNGAFNVTEFGTVQDTGHFRALYAYSPYHNVVDGTHYPDVLITADENDGRVNPSNSRKMVARLQAATSSEGYVLLRMSSSSGHGHGSALSEDIALYADTYAFLFDRLGMDFKPVTENASSNMEVSAMQDLRIEIVYDNNPFRKDLETAWGFSCLVRGTEKTILFDTGGDGSILLANMAKLGIDPKDIDLIVLSHKHWDHVGGLLDLLKKCNRPLVFMLKSIPRDLKRDAEALGAKVIEISEHARICENVFTTGEMGTQIKEQALILQTQDGLIIIAGCAHPGIVEMIKKAKDLLKEEVLFVMGGFHLLRDTPEMIETVISGFQELSVRHVAPTHCSGDVARELFKKAYGKKFIEIGAGKAITLHDLTEE